VPPSGRWMPNSRGTGEGLFLFRAEMTDILVSQNARCANCYQKRMKNLHRSKVEIPPGPSESRSYQPTRGLGLYGVQPQ
jgi:hypothetical protein